MLQDGLIFADGSVATNFQLDHSATLPISGTQIGELYYLTAVSGSNGPGLYIYTGSAWVAASPTITYPITGDVTGTVGGSNALTLATVNSNVGTYGSSTLIPIITTDANGRITSVSTASVTGFNAASNQMITGTWSFTNPVSGITPTLDAQLATKAYVDSVASGIDPKNSVRVATTANITLSGLQTIDGVSVVSGDRVLVKNQTLGANNGIYVAASGAWTRSTDFDGTPASEVSSGAYVFITNGTTQAATGFVLVTADPITIGTTSQSWTQFNASTSSGGTVTSVAVVGGSTGLTTSGGPVTVSGTITLAGTLNLASGGTGATTQAGAANAVLPAQSTNSGKFLTTDGTNVSWAAGAGAATATNIAGGTAGTVPYQSAASTTLFTGTGTVGQVLTSNGAAAPTWTTAGSSALTATYIGYGNASNALSGTSNFTFTTGTNTLTLGLDYTAVVIKANDFAVNSHNAADMTIRAGSSTNGSVSGSGNLFLQGGNVASGTSSAPGGNVTVSAGTASSSSGSGGNVLIQSGLTTTGASGGYISIQTSGATGAAQVERVRFLNNGAWSVGTGGAATGTAGQALTSAGASAPPVWSSTFAGILQGTGINPFHYNGGVVPTQLSTYGVYIGAGATPGGALDGSANISFVSNGSTTNSKLSAIYTDALAMYFNFSGDGMTGSSTWLKATRNTTDGSAKPPLIAFTSSSVTFSDSVTSPIYTGSGNYTSTGSATYTSTGTTNLLGFGTNSVQITTPTQASGNAGNINIQAGAGTTGNGASVTIIGGSGSGGGGSVNITAGAITGSGSGPGDMNLTLGNNAGGRGGNFALTTGAGTTAGGTMTFTTQGASAAANGPDITFNTGSGTTQRGSININAFSLIVNAPVVATTHTATGSVTLQSAAGQNDVNIKSQNNAASATGAILQTTGDATTSGNTGRIALTTGVATSGGSGNITFNTGAGTSTSGNMTHVIGAASSGPSGTFTVAIGSGSTNGGLISMIAGNGSGGVGGNWTMTAGNGSTTGGVVAITSGNGSSGVGGTITITSGTGSTGGAINVSSGTGAITLTGASIATVGRLDMKSSTETQTAPANAATQTIDCSAGNVFQITLSNSITSFTLSNIPASGKAYSMTLYLVQPAAGSKTVTWTGFTGLKWSNNTPPQLTTTAAKTDVITLTTFDGGATWYGFQAGQNM